MLAGVGSAGLGITSTRYLSQLRDSDPARAGRILGISAVVSATTAVLFALILFAGAPVLAARSLKAPELSGALRLSSLAVFFVAMNAFQTGSLMGLKAFRITAVAGALQGGLSLVTVLLLVPPFGLQGGVAALILTSGVVWLWSQIQLRAECRRYGIQISNNGIWKERAIFFEFAVPAALSGIAGQIAVWGSSAVLARQFHGMAQLGLFSAASSFKQIVLFAPSVLTRVAMPLLASLTGPLTHRTYRPSFNLNVRINALLCVGVASAVAVAAPFVLRIYGRSFSAALTATFVLLAAGALEGTSAAFFQALVGHGKIWLQCFFALIWSIILVLVSYLLCPSLGALGLGIGYLAGSLFYLLAYSAAARILNDAAEARSPAGMGGSSGPPLVTAGAAQ